MDYKQIILMRTDLNMRKGKMVAQGAHASMAAILNLATKDKDDNLCIPNDPRLMPWLTGKFKKICLKVNSESELLYFYNLALEKGLICSLILDSGLTEFNNIPTYTSVAIGPDTAEKIDALTKELALL